MRAVSLEERPLVTVSYMDACPADALEHDGFTWHTVVFAGPSRASPVDSRRVVSLDDPLALFRELGVGRIEGKWTLDRAYRILPEVFARVPLHVVAWSFQEWVAANALPVLLREFGLSDRVTQVVAADGRRRFRLTGVVRDGVEIAPEFPESQLAVVLAYAKLPLWTADHVTPPDGRAGVWRLRSDLLAGDSHGRPERLELLQYIVRRCAKSRVTLEISFSEKNKQHVGDRLVDALAATFSAVSNERDREGARCLLACAAGAASLGSDRSHLAWGYTGLEGELVTHDFLEDVRRDPDLGRPLFMTMAASAMPGAGEPWPWSAKRRRGPR